MSADFFRRLARNADRFATACAIQAAAAVVARASDAATDDVLQQATDTRDAPERDASGHYLPSEPRLRGEALYLAITFFDRPQRSVSRVVGISQPAVNKGIAKVEAWRDDPAYDRRLDELEIALMGVAA